MSRAFGKFFFASNFEPCACAAIDAVSNFHISWSWKLDGTCQIFTYRSCKPCQIFIYQKLRQARPCAAIN